MNKIQIKIKNLFKILNIDNQKYEELQTSDEQIFIKTPENLLTPILGYVKKQNNHILCIELENGIQFKCSENHIVIENDQSVLVKDALQLLTDTGYVNILNKSYIYDADVYDISIDDPHLYSTPNGIIHHNTCTAKVIAREILGCQYLYINASDENGIDTIRNKVVNFAMTKSIDGKIKAIILDEADQISGEAQRALRNTMEEYAAYCRFILTGNYKYKIIEPILSRCISLDLTPPMDKIVKRCAFILNQEKISLTEDQKSNFVKMIKSNYPDIRKCINDIQKYSIGGVFKIQDTQQSGFISGLYDLICKKDVGAVRQYLIGSDQSIYSDYVTTLRNMFNHIDKTETNETKKKMYLLTIAEHLYRATFVVDQEINAYACCIAMITAD